MALFWEYIVEYSTAPDGSELWEHIMAQEGGGTGSTYPVYYKELSLEMANCEIEINIPTIELDIDEPEYEIEIEKPTYEVEICNG